MRHARDVGGDPAADTLQIAVLGRMQCWSGRREVRLGPPKQRAVFAPLVLEPGSVVSMDRLVHAVWGDDAPLRAVEVVRTTVSRLRQVLGRNAIAATSGGYRLAAESDLDLTRTESWIAEARASAALGHLQAAAAVYRDVLEIGDHEPLAGVPGPYAQQHREAIQALFRTIRLECLGLELATGRAAEILPELTYARAENPLCERLALLTMVALLRLGRQAEALRVFESVRVSLRDELGVEPAADLRDMHLAILRNALAADSDLGRWLPGAPQDTPRGGEPGPETMTVPRQLPAPRAGFVGRSRELDELDAAMTDAGDLASPIALVTGPTGIGKTELALRWASTTATRFPGGHLFVRPSMGDTLRTVVQSLGVADPSHEPSILTSTFRSLTAERQMLVVLDDVDCPEHVRPFVPTNPRSGMVITSRRVPVELVACDGARVVRLHGLEPDASLDLLRRSSGRGPEITPESAARLAEALDGNPLALRRAGSRLLTQPAMSVHTLLRETTDHGAAPDRNGPRVRSGPAAHDAPQGRVTGPRSRDASAARPGGGPLPVRAHRVLDARGT